MTDMTPQQIEDGFRRHCRLHSGLGSTRMMEIVMETVKNELSTAEEYEKSKPYKKPKIAGQL